MADRVKVIVHSESIKKTLTTLSG